MKEIEKVNFLQKLKNQYVLIEGEKLVLEVKSSQADAKVAWFFEGQKLLASDFIEISSKGNVHTLVIAETVLDDEGVYSCVVENEAGKDETEAEVYIDEKKGEDEGEESAASAPEVYKGLSDKECLIDDEIRFDVEISGCTSVTWFMNDKQVVPSPRLELVSKDDRYSLVITSVTVEDDGEVKVVAVNSAGKTEVVCDLLVEGSDRFFS